MRTTRGLLAALIATASCEEGCWERDEDFVWRGPTTTVRGYGVAQADACAGSFTALEAQVAATRDFLEVRDNGVRYQYRWLSDEFWASVEPCPPGSGACARGPGVYSRELPDLHELAHAVLGGHDIGRDHCPALLDEGLATVLGGAFPNGYSPDPAVTGTAMLLLSTEAMRDRQGHYARAGHFVAYLVETFGASATASLCKRLPREATLSDWRREVVDVLGVSVGELLAGYETYPECHSQQVRARLRECAAAPDFALGADGNTWGVEVDCGDARAMNSLRGLAGDTATWRVLELVEADWVALVVYGAEPGAEAWVTIGECAPCSEGPVFIRQPVGEALHFLPAGRYEVVLYHERDSYAGLAMTKVGP